jgi:hypothetical protein
MKDSIHIIHQSYVPVPEAFFLVSLSSLDVSSFFDSVAEVSVDEPLDGLVSSFGSVRLCHKDFKNPSFLGD